MAIDGKLRILFFENNPAYFLSHRLPLARAVRDRGYEVHVATMPGPAEAAIRAAGFDFHPLKFSRGGMNPFAELRTLWRIRRLYRRLRPTFVYQVTIKPVIYGTLAARSARVPRAISVISGLGYFALQGGLGGRLFRHGIFALYRFALRHPRQKIVFHNAHDRGLFVQKGIVKADDAIVVPGSGVDTRYFSPLAEPAGVPVVILPARMLRDKGVYEFVAAAAALRTSGLHARFLLAGGADAHNPSAIPEAQLQHWNEAGSVEWLGHVSDMRGLYTQSHIVCLPSYREGLAKVLLEAGACGRPVVAADVPGCRDAVLAGETGLLVPSRDHMALAAALRQLIEDKKLRRHLGEAGRRHVAANFSVERVIAMTTAVLDALGETDG